MFGPRPVWSSAIFIGPDPLRSGWEIPNGDPDVLMDMKGIKLSSDAVHTIADPFVFTASGSNDLYLFAEEQRRGRVGKIKVWNIMPGVRPCELGELDLGNGHASFPFVFEDGGSVFMLPETSSCEFGGGDGEVALYAFKEFPTRVEKSAVLLKGPFTDSFLVKSDSHYFLFTSRDQKGLLYISEFLEGPYREHPASPISSNPKNARAAGALIPSTPERAFAVRPGQDCSSEYGGDLTLMRVREMTPDKYIEELWVEKAVAGRFSWAATGAHHISQCRWGNQTVTALDGRQDDYLVNRLLGAISQ